MIKYLWSRAAFSFQRAEKEASWACFSGAKIGVLCVFFWSRKFAAAVLFAAEILFSQFFQQSERLICAVTVKGNFFLRQFSGEIFINLS